MEKNEQQLPRLGEPVPAFEAMTTQGKISFPADYKGKWVILFSHPADFTPICTSEVLTFGARTAEFRALNCELIGLSVDSRNSHIAWLRTIREKIEYRGMKDIKVEFPIIDDVSMKVANLYGMIQPGESQTAAVRAVFFVDPEGKLRAMIYYPLALGRNFEENQLSPGSIGISPLSTPHPHPFQRMWVRSSTTSYGSFNLDMDRSPGFGSTRTDSSPS